MKWWSANSSRNIIETPQHSTYKISWTLSPKICILLAFTEKRFFKNKINAVLCWHNKRAYTDQKFVLLNRWWRLLISGDNYCSAVNIFLNIRKKIPNQFFVFSNLSNDSNFYEKKNPLHNPFKVTAKLYAT